MSLSVTSQSRLATGPADLSFERWKLVAQCQDFGAEHVVELNRAVATAMAGGLAAGLAIDEAIDAEGTLAGPSAQTPTHAVCRSQIWRTEWSPAT